MEYCLAKSLGLLQACAQTFVGSLLLASIAGAQGTGTIQVSSNQVIVPVDVINSDAYEAAAATPLSAHTRALSQGDMRAFEAATVLGLGVKDFELSEDGHRQTIQSVSFQFPPISEVTDNVGEHYEYIGPGGGRWVFPDWPVDGKFHALVPLPFYLLSYNPPPASEGSCHNIEVNVRHYDEARVYTLTRYCRTRLISSDPLRTTKFGQHMETDLDLPKRPKISVSLTGAVLFSQDGRAHVSIAMDFSPGNLRYDYSSGRSGTLIETIGMLGRAYRSDGSVAIQFSDFRCCSESDTDRYGIGMDFIMVQENPADPNLYDAPRSYNTRIALPPGEYAVRVVLSDNHNFGRAETRVTVPEIVSRNIALSDIVLAKRCRPLNQPPARYELPEEAKANSSTISAPAYVPLVSKGIEYVPTADLNFKKGEQFFFYFETFEPQLDRQPAESVQAHVRIVDATTGAIVRNLAPLNATNFAIPGNPIIPIGSGIHIDDLPPGQYRLEAQATTVPAASASLNTPPPSPQTTPWHSVSFSVQ